LVMAGSFAVTALPALPAAASALSIVPADGQTVKLWLTGDRQTLESDTPLGTWLTLQRTGDAVAVMSEPRGGTPLPGNASLQSDGSLLIVVGDLAVQLNAINLISTVAVAAPDPISFVSTWNVTVPVVAGGARVSVPVTVIVSDASPAHIALGIQGRGTATLQGKNGPVVGTVTVQCSVDFRNGAFAGASGTIFSDASPSSGVHSVTNWRLLTQAT